MSEFQTTPKPLEMDEPTYRDRLKNLKELKVGDGLLDISQEGEIGIGNSAITINEDGIRFFGGKVTFDKDGTFKMRDSSNNIVILLDPNG
jgi:hypothetical protein